MMMVRPTKQTKTGGKEGVDTTADTAQAMMVQRTGHKAHDNRAHDGSTHCTHFMLAVGFGCGCEEERCWCEQGKGEKGTGKRKRKQGKPHAVKGTLAMTPPQVKSADSTQTEANKITVPHNNQKRKDRGRASVVHRAHFSLPINTRTHPTHTFLSHTILSLSLTHTHFTHTLEMEDIDWEKFKVYKAWVVSKQVGAWNERQIGV